MITATNVGQRFRTRWVLRHCSFAVPAGRVVGLVGPNGAGKTTLLRVLAGLLRPTEGAVRLNGHDPAGPEGLPAVAFLAQSKPLYPRFTVADSVRFCRELNPRFDEPFARERLLRLGIPRTQRVGKLSGGQRAQVALALALAKRPRLLLLDEPVASLDPLARREFLQALMGSVAESGTTVLLSSHLLADLERVCDHLILLQGGRVQISGAVDELIPAHRQLVGPRHDGGPIAGVAEIVRASHTDRQSTLLVRLDGGGFAGGGLDGGGFAGGGGLAGGGFAGGGGLAGGGLAGGGLAGGGLADPAWTVHEVTLEEIGRAHV